MVEKGEGNERLSVSVGAGVPLVTMSRLVQNAVGSRWACVCRSEEVEGL